MRKLILIAALLAAAIPAQAADPPVFKLYGGANAVWFNGALDLPSDFELGANLRASLSPHISGVSCLYYGLNHSYLRGSFGVRLTATDVDNRDFSIGVGIQRQLSSRPEVRPEEWAPDVTVGWRPWPQTAPRVILIAQGSYGLDSQQGTVLAGVRYFLTDFEGGKE